MESPDLYQNIKTSIEKHFNFLFDFNFQKITEKQLAYEYHFITTNNIVTLDFWFEATLSTPIWVKIENYYVDTLELDNAVVNAYRQHLKDNYDIPFKKYLETKESMFLTEITDRYVQNGREIHDHYLREIGEILKRHPAVLAGDLTLLEETSLLLEAQRVEKIAYERIQKNIYILEYQFFSTTEYDCFEEFTTLEDIRLFLTQQRDIKHYRVLDWNQNIVGL